MTGVAVKGTVRSRVGPLVRANRARVAGALGAVVVFSAVVAASPAVTRNAIDDGILAGDRGALRVAVLVLVGLLLVGGVASGVRAVCMADLAQRFLHDLRRESLAGLLRLDLGRYEASRRGDLHARVTADVTSLGDAAESLMPDVTRDLIIVGGGLVAVGFLSPALLAVALVTLPPALLAGRWLLRRSGEVYPRLLADNGVALGVLGETVEGAPTIAALGAQDRQLDRLAGANRTLVASNVDAAGMRNRFYSTLLVIQSVGTAAVVVAGGLLALDDRVTVGTATAAVLALAAVYGSLGLVLGRLDDVLTARAALDRVLALAGEPGRSGGVADLPDRGELHLDAVSYSYPVTADGGPDGAVDASGADADLAAVREVTLRIAAGEHVALVGVTGSGKSTLGRLAAGLAVPSAGRVRLGGVDLADAAPGQLRNRLLLVPQDTFLVPGSIADNARLAHPDRDDTAVEQAVDALGLRSWVESLPAGLATDVGTGGARLSSGERQLVTLLRVALADPALIVLDESTSVLDPTSEQSVAGALKRLTQGRAVLVIAHRPATARRCDRLAVMADGRLVQVGTPDEVLAGSALTDLWAETAGVAARGGGS